MNGIKLENFSNYWIFPDLGMVWSIPRKDKLGRTVSGGWIGSPNEKGYWQVGLTDDNGEKKHFLLARLIWMSVNGDIPDSMEINHKSERKDENFISNLSLTSKLENIRYGTGIQRRAEKQRNDPNRSKKVAAYKDGVLAMVFSSTMEAERNGFKHSHVSACCNGKIPHYKGYQWLFYVDTPPLFYIAA